MKYAILVGDGMADFPLPELDNRTPLEYAATPEHGRGRAHRPRWACQDNTRRAFSGQ